MEKAILVIGLGNPGLEYRISRHNIGFMVLDNLAVAIDARFTRFQAKALIATTLRESRKIILAKPQTYMNLSGKSVGELTKFYKINMKDILVVYDEIYLPVGYMRIRPNGGSGGHQGMNSILERIGTSDIPRLRIGIGSPPGHMKAEDYVLANPTEADLQLLGDTFQNAVDAILIWIEEGIDAAMNKYNKKQL